MDDFRPQLGASVRAPVIKLEEVARVIAPEAFAEFPSERLAIAWRDKARERVCAGLRALRNPTQEMLEAGMEASPMSLFDEKDGRRKRMSWSTEECGVVWQAMIDAILGEAKR